MNIEASTPKYFSRHKPIPIFNIEAKQIGTKELMKRIRGSYLRKNRKYTRVDNQDMMKLFDQE